MKETIKVQSLHLHFFIVWLVKSIPSTRQPSVDSSKKGSSVKPGKVKTDVSTCLSNIFYYLVQDGRRKKLLVLLRFEIRKRLFQATWNSREVERARDVEDFLAYSLNEFLQLLMGDGRRYLTDHWQTCNKQKVQQIKSLYTRVVSQVFRKLQSLSALSNIMKIVR